MSATRIISQAAAWLLAGAPNTRQLTLVHLRASIGGGAGVATVLPDIDATSGDAGTTPALTIARESAGIYNVTFPACRQLYTGSLVCNLLVDSAFATANNRQAAFDRTDANTAAKLGKLRVGFYTGPGAAVATELPDNSEIHLSFWADFG